MRISPALDRWLRVVLVTPRMHWLHHSRWQPETNSNYASVFSVWDRLFGTMRSRRHAETVEIGLDGYDSGQIESLRGIIATPFHRTRSEYGQTPPATLLEPDESLFSRPSRQPRPDPNPGSPGIRPHTVR